MFMTYLICYKWREAAVLFCIMECRNKETSLLQEELF